MAQLNFAKDGESMQAAVKTEIILDSGERRDFGTGAVRDAAEGKGRCDLLPLDVVSDLLSEDDVLSEINEYVRNGGTQYLLSAIYNFRHHKEDLYTAMLDVSKHFEAGCKKYGDRNWEKGIPCHCYIDSAVRHYIKYLRGDDDEAHDRAFIWNLMCCVWTHAHLPEMIDLPFKGNKSATHAPVQTAGPSYTCGDCRYIQNINASKKTACGCEKYYRCNNMRSHNGIVTPETPACSVCEPCGKVQ